VTHDEPEPEASAVQRRWERIAGELREALRVLIAKVPEMTAEQAKHLAEALDSAMWLEWKAAVLDKRTELELRKTFGD
jgi:hypothetical protein